MFGSTLRSGEFIFGSERGRMSLASADVTSEQVMEDGVTYTNITITSSLSGLAPDSLLTKSFSKIARAVGPASDRFHTTLRTSDAALAAEWVAVLRNVCGRQRSSGLEKLQSLILRGEVSYGSPSTSQCRTARRFTVAPLVHSTVRPPAVPQPAHATACRSHIAAFQRTGLGRAALGWAAINRHTPSHYSHRSVPHRYAVLCPSPGMRPIAPIVSGAG